MKKYLLIGAAMLALPTAALAVDGTVNIDGSVADRCKFTGETTATISLGEISDEDGELDASTVNTESATLTGWCNGTAATMSVAASRLSNVDHTGTVPSGFTTSVDYTATAAANGVTASDSTTTEDGGDSEDVGLFVGDIVVTLSAAAATGLLVAGDYEGSVIVTLTPNVSFNLPVEQES